MSLVVRPLKADDGAEWRRLWTGYLQYYETVLPSEVYDSTFARLLSGEPGEFRGLIAEVEGRPVGLTHYLFLPSTWSMADVCYLQDLYADPGVRGLGVGRALIEAVYAAADKAGVADVHWLTQDFNATARRLYDRIGVKTPFIRYNRPAVAST